MVYSVDYSVNMSNSRDDCHLCHIHDHNHPSSLLRTSTLRDSSPPPRPRRHSRSGSIDKQYRSHHSDHNHHNHHNHNHHHHHDRERHHSRAGRVPSALARLSEHSSHSLPASRSNTLNLYPEQVSVLPDGGHRYLGGDRTSVRSLELTSPRHAPDNRSHHSLQHVTSMQKPSHLHSSTDILTNSMPALRSHGSHLSLNHLPLGLTSPETRTADFFMPGNRLPYKDDSRKHRFNLQTVMLIGCYTLLFVMAIIVGVVLCHQNGWLGFGSPETLSATNRGIIEAGRNNALGSVRTSIGNNNHANSQSKTGQEMDNQLSRLKEDASNPPVPVHNVVQFNNPDPATVNVAGVFGATGSVGGQPRSISGSIPGNRPIQQLQNNNPQQDNLNTSQMKTVAQNINQNTSNNNNANNNVHRNIIQNSHIHSTPNNNQHNQFGQGNNLQGQRNVNLQGDINRNAASNFAEVPLPTLVNASPGIPVPALITPAVVSQHNGGHLSSPPDTIHVHETIFLTNPPNNPIRNPFNTFASSLQPNIQQQNVNPVISNHNQHTPSIFNGNNNGNNQVPNTFTNVQTSFGNQAVNPSQSNIISQQQFNVPLQTHQSPVHNGNSPQGVAQPPLGIQQINSRTAIPITQEPVINIVNPKVAQQPELTFPPPFIVRKVSKDQRTPVPQQHNVAIQPIQTLRSESNLNSNFKLSDDSSIQINPTILDKKNSKPQLSFIKQKNNLNNGQKPNNPQINQIHLEKMKMLKEILDAEGSGKLLQDLITLKNNQNSLAVISQHLSETTSKHGPSPSVNSPPPQRNIAGIASAAILKHRDRLNAPPSEFTSASSQAKHQNIQSPNTGNIRNSGSRNSVPNTQQGNSGVPKSKSNIQMVRELLASLVNSPEVQEILNSRNRQSVTKSQLTGRAIPNSSSDKGEEMRQILLKALAKEIPDGQTLQRLRVHGPQPSINIQTDAAAKRAIQRGARPGKITRAQQVGIINSSRSGVNQKRRTIPSRRFLSRMGAAESKKLRTSVEHQSIRPPIPRRTSRGRQKPGPGFSLNVKNDGKSNAKAETLIKENKKLTESVDMKTGEVKGEVVRHWRHMDTEGTVSQGTVRRDGSFSFTNCRPAIMCQNKMNS